MESFSLIREKFIEIATPPQGNALETPLVHLYGVCERRDLSLLAEPANVISSFLLLIVAMALFKSYFYNKEVRQKPIPDIHILTACVFFIGVASMTFHMVPSYYTELADIIFIVFFIIVYFTSVLVRVTGLNWFQVVVALIAFFSVTKLLVSNFPNAMNDSIAYLSSMGALIFTAIYLNIKRRYSARSYLLAAVIGCVSLFFRVIDNEICEYFSIGTHFMWHSLNSILIYIIMMQLIRNVNRRARMLRMYAEHKEKQRNK